MTIDYNHLENATPAALIAAHHEQQAVLRESPRADTTANLRLLEIELQEAGYTLLDGEWLDADTLAALQDDWENMSSWEQRREVNDQRFDEQWADRE